MQERSPSQIFMMYCSEWKVCFLQGQRHSGCFFDEIQSQLNFNYKCGDGENREDQTCDESLWKGIKTEQRNGHDNSSSAL
jgi:hypothetical protein